MYVSAYYHMYVFLLQVTESNAAVMGAFASLLHPHECSTGYYICTHTYVCIYVYMYVCMYVCMYVIRMYVIRMYIIRMYVCVCMHVCMYIRMHMYIYIYISSLHRYYMYMYTCMNAYTKYVCVFVYICVYMLQCMYIYVIMTLTSAGQNYYKNIYSYSINTYECWTETLHTLSALLECGGVHRYLAQTQAALRQALQRTQDVFREVRP